MFYQFTLGLMSMPEVNKSKILKWEAKNYSWVTKHFISHEFLAQAIWSDDTGWYFVLQWNNNLKIWFLHIAWFIEMSSKMHSLVYIEHGPLIQSIAYSAGLVLSNDLTIMIYWNTSHTSCHASSLPLIHSIFIRCNNDVFTW